MQNAIRTDDDVVAAAGVAVGEHRPPAGATTGRRHRAQVVPVRIDLIGVRPQQACKRGLGLAAGRLRQRAPIAGFESSRPFHGERLQRQ